MNLIEGYINHNRSKYGKLSLNILFLIYEKGYLKRYWKETGNGWRLYWWRPSNWVSNLIHLIKKRGDSIPVNMLKRKFSESYNKLRMRKQYDEDFNPYELGDDLPF